MNDRTLRFWSVLALALVAGPLADCTPLRAADNDQKDRIDQLIRTLGSKDYRTRYRAASALVRIGAPAVKPLITALGSKDTGTRAAVPHVFAQMCESMWYRRGRETSMPASDLNAAINPLNDLTRDVSSKVRSSAYRALAYLDDKQREEILTAALRDTDAGVRAVAGETAWYLRRQAVRTPQGTRPVWPGETVDKQLIDALVACLKREGDERWLAAGALGVMGDRRAVEPLIAATKHKDHQFRGTAIAALGRLGGPRALAALKTLVEERNWRVRCSAVRALGETQDPDALGAMLPILTDNRPDVRKAASGALREMARKPRGAKAVLARIKQVREPFRKELALIAEDTVFMAGADLAMRKRLATRIPKLDFDDHELKDVLHFLRDISGVNLFVDWRALAKVDVTGSTKVSQHLRNVPVDRALGLILPDADKGKRLAGRTIVAGCMVVSTRAELAKLSRLPVDLMPPKPAGEADLAVWKRLAVKMRKIDLADIQLSDVVQFLRDVSGMRIEVDWPALEELGVKKTTPVSVHLFNISLGAAMQFVLIDAGGIGKLGYSIKGGMVVISKAKPPKAARKSVIAGLPHVAAIGPVKRPRPH